MLDKATNKASITLTPKDRPSNAGVVVTSVFTPRSLSNVTSLAVVVFVKIIRRCLNSLEQYEGQLDFLYFLLLFDVFYAASLETIFSYGYLPFPFSFL